MSRPFLRSCVVVPLIAGALSAQTPQAQSVPLSYPAATRGTQSDVYHGVTVADPYRWLEDTDAPETKAWIEAQNRMTESYLAATPERAAIRNRLTHLWNYARTSAPFKEGDRYFYFQNSGLLNQSILYVQDRRNAPPRILLDPNTLSPDGTIALRQATASRDGRLLAYSLSTSGSDWQEIRVRDVTTGRDLSDVGLFDEADRSQSLHFHMQTFSEASSSQNPAPPRAEHWLRNGIHLARDRNACGGRKDPCPCGKGFFLARIAGSVSA